MGCAKDLCIENVASFYKNLKKLYAKCQYPLDHVWSCDESGAQARKNGGRRVSTKKDRRAVHQIIPNEHEWLTILTSINAI